MIQKIGVLGGSFDPIHLGHLNLAINLLERCGLDQVLFCPACCSPFKTNAPPQASNQDRLEMIRLAIQDIPQFQLLDFELTHPAPSYTIDTIRFLASPQRKLYLLLSSEVAASFHLWKEAEELLRLAPPLIGCRNLGPIEGPWQEKLRPYLIQTPCFDISSTEIRSRLKKRLYCEHLIPKPTLDFIHSKQLYC